MIEIPRRKVIHLETLFIYSLNDFFFRFQYKLEMLLRMQLLSANRVILPKDSTKILTNKDICVILRTTAKT